LTTNDEENELIALSLTFQTAAYEQIAQANQTTKKTCSLVCPKI